MGDGARNKPGRKAFVATDAQREVVRASGGMPLGLVAAEIGVSLPTLRKAFAAELAARGSADLFAGGGAGSPPRRRAGTAGGRKAARFNAFQRADVESWVALGMTVANIARALGVSEPTLRKHCAEELATGEAKVEARMLSALNRAAAKGSVAAQREALGLIERARLARLQESLDDRPRAETPGKKEIAKMDAAEAMAESKWGVRPVADERLN